MGDAAHRTALTRPNRSAFCASVSAGDGEPPTIYERAGGRPVFERWFDVFHDLVEADDLLVDPSR